MDSQEKQILNYLRLGKRLTQLKALNLFGCLRLGARVWDLRQKGHDIKRTLITNGAKHFAEYYLIK